MREIDLNEPARSGAVGSVGSALRTIFFLALATALCGHARAQVPAEKYAGDIKAYTDAATYAKDTMGTWLDAAQEIPAFTKGDVALITAYMQENAAAWTSAAAALQNGDKQAAEPFVKRARELERKRDIWPQRLAWRRGQAQIEYLPASEESYDTLVGDRKPDELKEIDALMEAKKRRSEVYGRLADAATPDADPLTLVKLQDEVFAADVEVQVADMKRDWATEDRELHRWTATDSSVSSPEYTAAKDQLEDWRRKHEEIYRKSREVEHELARQKRQYQELLTARSDAYKAAKAARDRDKK